MGIYRTRLGASAIIILATMFLGVDIGAAYAQDIRNWSRRVATGKEMEFQWLSYDEKACKDHGYPRFIVNKRASLGKYRTVKRKFTQQSGRCRGTRLSVLLVYYVAGRTKGVDQTSYTIRGRSDIRVNLRMRVY